MFMSFRLSQSGVLVCSLLVFALSAPISAAAQETIRVAVPLLPTTAFPQMLGNDKGFFQKKGLRVEFIRINSEPTTYQALISGDVQVTSGAPVGLVLSHLQGVDLVALGSWQNVVPYTIATREKITDLSQLKGKKIGINRLGGRSALILRVMLEDAGLDSTKDVVLLQLGGSQERLAALLSGGIDAGPVEATLEPKIVSLGLSLFRAKRTPFMTSPSVVRKSYLQANRAAMKKFMEVYLESTQYIQQNKEDSLRTLSRILGTSDKQVLDHAYEDIVANMQPNLIPPSEAVKNLLKMVAFTDKKALTVRPEKILDLSLVEEIRSSQR
jgi:ABC-type nitrate/sulfonate/bicarbonate transport system substrate-binding protein